MRPAVSLLFVCLMLLPCAAHAGDADALAMEGHNALNAGEYELAAENFLAAIEEEKSHKSANTGLLKLYLLVGDYKQAAERADALAEGNAATAQMLALGGDARMSAGEYEKALEAYRKGVALDASSIHALLGAARVLTRHGKAQDARKLFKQARALYQGSASHPVEAMVHAADVCIELNRYTEANSILDDALKKEPGNLAALVLRGTIFLEKYDYPFAKKLFEKALSINPCHPDALAGLAWTYDRITELGPGRFRNARSYARKALQANRCHAGANIYLAYSELTDNNFQRAKKYINRALKANPHSTDALALLGALYMVLDDGLAYERTRRKAFKLKGARAMFLNGVASILQTRFRYEEALDLALAALKLNQEYWPAYSTAGLNLLRLGREKEAKEYLEKSYESDPFNVWTYNSLALLAHMKDNFKEKKTKHFVIKMHGGEFDTAVPYVARAAEWSYRLLSKKYACEPKTPVLIELFRKHKYFSARTVGLPGIPAAGACFGPLVTMDSPSARPPGSYNWAKTLHHELTHVFTLLRSKNRVSHWFGEGLSVYEESAAHPHWRRNMERAFIDAMEHGALASIGNLEKRFSKPRSIREVLLAYYQSSLVVEFIIEKFGFPTVLAMLDAYAAGKGESEIFKACLGSDAAQLDGAFAAYAKARFSTYKVAGRIDASHLRRLKDEAEFAPSYARAHARLARAYLAAGKLLDAQISIKRALRLDAKDPQALLAQAQLDMVQGFIPSAKTNFLKALSGGLEKTYDVHLTLSRIYFGEDKKEEAIQYLNKAISDFPRDASRASPYRMLYHLYNESGNRQKAFEQLEKLVSISGRELPGRMALTDSYLEEKKYALARRTANQVLDLSPLIPGVHERLGDALYGLEKFDEAIKEYKTAIVVGPKAPARAYAGLAKCFLEKKDSQAAGEYARKALDADPANEAAREVLEALGKGDK